MSLSGSNRVYFIALVGLISLGCAKTSNCAAQTVVRRPVRMATALSAAELIAAYERELHGSGSVERYVAHDGPPRMAGSDRVSTGGYTSCAASSVCTAYPSQ